MIVRAARAVAAAFVLASTLGVAPGLAPCAGVAHAQGTNHAGLVVHFASKPARTYCVEFTEESITGIELLERTGLAVALQDYGGGNLAVCAIDGEGCDYPRKPCFCQCTNLAACTIWGFYTLDDKSEWTFSQQGAALTKVGDGDVHGWRWAKSTTSGGAPPDATTLQKLCKDGTRIQASAARAPAGTSRSGGTPPWPAAVAFAVLLGAFTARFLNARARRQQQ